MSQMSPVVNKMCHIILTDCRRSGEKQAEKGEKTGNNRRYREYKHSYNNMIGQCNNLYSYSPWTAKIAK
jgi:hypothetical protein